MIFKIAGDATRCACRVKQGLALSRDLVCPSDAGKQGMQ